MLSIKNFAPLLDVPRNKPASTRSLLMTRPLRCLLIALLPCSAAALAEEAKTAVAEPLAPEVQTVDVTYLGNEGFLIAAGDRKVLVDALFGDGIDGYPVVPPTPRRQLEAAAGDFAGVDLVLATHYHDDHFDAQAVARHLRANPDARFVSTRQAVERLRQLPDFDQLADRVEGYWPAEGERVSMEHGGIAVTILNLHHGRDRRPEVQNLGFLIDLGGLQLLHVGDTEVDEADVRPYRLAEEAVDVFFVPSWFFGSLRWRPVLAEVDAGARVVMHLAEPTAPASWFGPAGSREKRLAGIREVDPEAVVFRAMETRSFSSRSD